ncbi:Na/Pi symporter [Piscibacillus salipiscarius]|uniref:Na/Pi symporter n=1 Tax=Piscibacillus salipiscarius TaxID=299480 RepID=UPI002436FF8E|nr:Na/Pi symporter [Piscibacillus salipiscarius]
MNVVKTGYSLMGFTLVIGSLCIMDVLATDMKESIFYYDLFNKIDHSSFIAVLTGIIHTTLGQSNSTINEIATLFATENFYTGIPLIIGANIGTGVMAMIASLVTMKEARLTAYAYLWLNILGAIFIYPFLDYLVELKNILTPAQVNIMYNITLSLITLPFVKYYSSFIDRIYHWRQKSPM